MKRRIERSRARCQRVELEENRRAKTQQRERASNSDESNEKSKRFNEQDFELARR
jgi:hypothetical protein